MCWSRAAGWRRATSVTGFFRARVFTSYPDQFSGAIPMVAGNYIVIWKEQDPPQTGKWRVIDLSRVTVPALTRLLTDPLPQATFSRGNRASWTA